MDDRALLEAAAKAAGMETRFDRATSMFRARFPGSGDTFPVWNPFHDDGDALRLAVKLGIGLAGSESHVWACKLRMCDIHEPRGSDSYAATRRAIVRAAAAMAAAVAAERERCAQLCSDEAMRLSKTGDYGQGYKVHTVNPVRHCPTCNQARSRGCWEPDCKWPCGHKSDSTTRT